MEEDVNRFLNEHMELIILPTEQCNFRCLYCNQHFKQNKMHPETVVAIKRLLDQRIPELKMLIIQWFGGEPLMAHDIILDIMGYIAKIKETVNPSLKVASTVTTNAYLLSPERLAELVALGVDDFQITLDGAKKEHDMLRKKADGSGTFDRIWSNITAAHRTSLRFDAIIRLHVNAENSESMKEVLEQIAKEMGDDERFKVFIRLLSKFGSPNDSTLPITEDTVPVKELKEFAQQLSLSQYKLDIYNETSGYLCYASKPFSYVIRANGDISKCTVALYAKPNIVGHLNSDGTIQLDESLINRWSRGMFSGDAKELACPLKGLYRKDTESNLKGERLKVLV